MHLDAIGIVTKDMKRSVAFYRLLGLTFPDVNEGDEHIEAELPSGLRLMIDSESLIKKLKPNWLKPVGQRITLAFLCEAPEQVDEVYKKLIQAGYSGEQKPWDAFWGQRYASILDPDGNAVDMFASLASDD